jgi:hypothetical protein
MKCYTMKSINEAKNFFGEVERGEIVVRGGARGRGKEYYRCAWSGNRGKAAAMEAAAAYMIEHHPGVVSLSAK